MESFSPIRCAIYTRKSTDEGLEKEFNTLEAQREAGENYIRSMKHQGWVILPEHYDDGGFSGGSLKRPALKQLLSDVEAGKVDMIVVYKIDRLTRSLLDFAQLVKIFEKHCCSFVSVTQHFNTCDSMGKLTLNILLSFAQFERELGAERVRDKIAASKKKGMWTGGPLPLGYDSKNKKLVINKEEAEIVRFIFEDYKRTGSQFQTVRDVNEKGYIPTLTLVSPKISLDKVYSYTGINSLDQAVEFNPSDKVFISTKHTEADFPKSLLQISTVSSAYDIIKTYEDSISLVNDDFGTVDEWSELLKRLQEADGWETLISNEFGGIQNLPFRIDAYAGFDEFKKWLYVLMLKLYSSEIVTGYLSKVLQRVSSYKDFVSALFQTILNFDHTDSEFSSLYLERKCILKNFAKETEEICEYCKLVSAKGKSGLFYLTDNTNLEKQTVIGLLGRYASELNANDINSILKVVYPDLYSYMGEYNFEHPLLKGYFQAYKYQKLFNHISSDFAKVVEEQAVKREYNSILRPRVSYLEKIDTKNTMVYFVDALGVEYLSFILAQCNSNNLFANVTVCRSELPSITCMNKEFVDVFSSAGCKIIDIKDLDELKHHGTNDFDYQITKEPIHLIEELNIIATVLEKIRTNIASGKCEKAIIISDHGASRLAVINETENKYEMSEKGEHSGRCCPVSDIDEKPDFATEENGYWVLANYDRFKGGRKANVEVHGGAALEEVCVPIIEITPQNEKIDVRLLDSYKNITVSFRKSALIKFFINKKLNNLKVKIEGKYYDAQPTAEEFVYQVSMPDIRKAKNYIFDVYASENMIASGLQFNVKSEVTVEKDLF